MGQGSYQAADWVKLCARRGLKDTMRPETIFPTTGAQKSFNSRYIACREARDSIDSPQSTPVIIGFDVTASMGYLAKELALHTMHRTILSLLEDRPIRYPQILCAAIGDSRCDTAPLQVTQFEADIRIIEQMTSLYLEGGGGGNGGESYHLLWYFAAHHTATDHFEKRHKKGYLFTLGDDVCHQQLTAPEIKYTFGTAHPYGYANAELLSQAEERYHIFHIHIDTDRSFDDICFTSWRSLLGGHALRIHRHDLSCLPQLLCSVIAINEGQDRNTVLKHMNQDIAERIAPSVALLTVTPPAAVTKTITF
ncbi:MAG: hypothetical protein VZR73_02055 [Acutalibacteraceae bacterium]|nr:hypothetical protein [Acutalibacteraceae bacterium]